MRTHLIKTWPDSFQLQVDGEKLFEVRFNDRLYQKGDVVVQKEFILYDTTDRAATGKTGRFTGRELWRKVGFVLSGFGVQPGHVAMQLEQMNHDELKAAQAAIAKLAG